MIPSRLSSAIGSLFKSLRGPRDQAVDDELPPPPGHDDDSHAASAAAFEAQFRHSAQAQDGIAVPLVAGSLQIVTLSDLGNELGEMWPALTQRWIEIATEEIRQEVGPADFFQPHHDNMFLVCFTGLSKGEAKLKTDRISRQIRARLVEEMPEAAGRIAIDRLVGEIDADALLANGLPLSDALVVSLRNIRAEATQRARVDRAGYLREARIRFQPLWNVRRSRLAMNRCMLDSRSGGATLLHLQSLSERQDVYDAIEQLDCLLLTKSLEALHHAFIDQAAHPELIVPVHFSTLNDGGAPLDFLGLLEMLPPHYRKFVTLDVHGVPASADVFELLDVLTRVSPFSVKVAVRLSPRDARLGRSMKSILWGLSLDLSRWKAEPKVLESVLPSFAREAAARGLKTIVHDADTLGAARLARSAGFDFIGGAAIHLIGDTPKGPAPFNPLDGRHGRPEGRTLRTSPMPMARGNIH